MPDRGSGSQCQGTFREAWEARVILDEQLADGRVIVLDGATGTEIRRRGGQIDGAAWSAVANLSDPETVQSIHESYIRAGAQVITTNTFATARHVLAAAGLANQTVALNRLAVELAQRARDRARGDRPIAIAGSISTMHAFDPATERFDPRYHPTPEAEAANYRELAETLAEAGVDLLLLEMMLDLDRAPRAVPAAVATGLPVWVGMSCTRRADGSLVGWDIAAETGGEPSAHGPPSATPPLAELIDALTGMGGQAAGIMHSSIASTTPGLELLFERWDGPVMAYPETSYGGGPDGARGATVPPEQFAAAARAWVERGVQIVGGCCGTTVEHIAALAAAVPAHVGKRPAG